MSDNRPVPSREDRIKARAYQLWEQAGCPEGHDAEFWELASREIDADPNDAGGV
jgi:hypothetical protein